jgi:hypothetical protein
MMPSFPHDMRSDLETVIKAIEKTEPFALVRFGDGEGSMLRLPPADKERQKYVKGQYETWDVREITPKFRSDLLKSLEEDIEGYCIGINCTRCDLLGHHYCLEHMKIAEDQMTFAEIFGWANYDRAAEAFLSIRNNGSCLVTCGPEADHEVPHDICVRSDWDEDEVVAKLLKENRPILVAAGPGACTIIHKYWKRQEPAKRVPIVDIGAVLDPVIHDGEISRCYQIDGHWGRTGAPMGPGEHQICRWHN